LDYPPGIQLGYPRVNRLDYPQEHCSGYPRENRLGYPRENRPGWRANQLGYPHENLLRGPPENQSWSDWRNATSAALYPVTGPLDSLIRTGTGTWKNNEVSTTGHIKLRPGEHKTYRIVEAVPLTFTSVKLFHI
jgi:hypothetical protein